MLYTITKVLEPMFFYRCLIRPCFFRFSPETAHHLAVWGLKALAVIPGGTVLVRALFDVKSERLKQELFGVTFDNPVGFAAGFDKNAEVVDPLAAFGFSHIEVGTLTRLAQPGNPKPRCFRLKPDRSIINRMGLNNLGAEAVGQRLIRAYGPARGDRRQRPSCILGVNIGKSTAVNDGEALADQLGCLEQVAAAADYLVVNVSCPNVKGVTGFQAADRLRPLLAGLRTRLTELEPECRLLVKVSPDLDRDALEGLAEVALDCGCDGFIATNTTTTRRGLSTSKEGIEAIGNGGLSGAALRRKSTEALASLARHVNGRVPIIGVGGIEDVDSAWEKITHGASLVQVYTGFIFTGPDLARQINRGLEQKLKEHGFPHLRDAVGSAL